MADSIKLKSWISAFRLRTFPLAIASIGMGGFLAASKHSFNWIIFLLTILTTILLQILSNLANDYGDSENGADNKDRIGPLRTVQTGAISKTTMKNAIVVFVILSLISGLLLILVALGWNYKFLFFLILGILSIAAAIKYTAGKNPYGYAGLGDLSVFIFFGLVGVIGSFYLHTNNFYFALFLPASSCGFFSAAVLNINNMRDIESDCKAEKNSLPVRIGLPNAKLYHYSLLVLGISCSLIYAFLYFKDWYQFLFLLVIPFLVFNAYNIYKSESKNMDVFLKQMALTTLAFVLSFGLGLIY